MPLAAAPGAGFLDKQEKRLKLSESLAEWQASRRAELSAPDSWLGLAGLFWLEDGENGVGSAEGNAVRLPSGAACLGRLRVEGSRVYWQAAGESERELETDRNGTPAAVHSEKLAFFIVEREGRLAARVRDLDWASQHAFAGLDYFPANAEWVCDAQWREISPALVMEVPNVTGELKSVEVRHKAVFAAAGQPVELLPMSESDREVFFVFRDRTSGKESYGAGRFLKAQPAENGRIVLDFNRAYNPPCAFTPFATCPLPPPENWLPFPVPAGEKKYSGEH